MTKVKPRIPGTTLFDSDQARKGYALIELSRFEEADAALAAALAEWRKVSRLDDPYYIAMAHYYRGELAHRRPAVGEREQLPNHLSPVQRSLNNLLQIRAG